MVAAWLQLGEVYMHLLPVEGRTDSLAEAAFSRARALDSTSATPQFIWSRFSRAVVIRRGLRTWRVSS